MDRQFDELIQRCRELDAQDVVEELSIEKAKQRHKYGCPGCNSSDALHVYPGSGRGAHCFSCGEHFDAIDLVRQIHALDFRGAVELLAERFGFAPVGDNPANAERSRRLRQQRQQAVQRRREMAERERAGRRHRAVEIWAGIHAGLTLGEAGRQYLRSRGIPLEAAEHLGIRSVETMSEWADHCAPFSDDELRVAGLVADNDRGSYPVPWRAPFLVITYIRPPSNGRGSGSVDMLRFRALDGSKPKYIAPSQHRPMVPYLAGNAVRADRASTLYICEGELNALSVLVSGELAIGSAGANEWRDEWCDPLRAFQRVVVLCDGDEAGSGFARTVARSIKRVLGADWTHRHVRQRRFAAGVDANDALISGELGSMLGGCHVG